MFKITGLDKLSKELTNAQKALEALDGELGTIAFDPRDPSSIEAAIQEVERLIDERIGPYASNPIVGPMAEEMKEQYREAILEQAASERLKNEHE